MVANRIFSLLSVYLVRWSIDGGRGRGSCHPSPIEPSSSPSVSPLQPLAPLSTLGPLVRLKTNCWSSIGRFLAFPLWLLIGFSVGAGAGALLTSVRMTKFCSIWPLKALPALLYASLRSSRSSFFQNLLIESVKVRIPVF